MPVYPGLIRECREHLGWSQTRLGKIHNIDQSTVSLIERDAASLLACTLRAKLKEHIKASARTPHFDARAGELLARLQEAVSPEVAAACPKDLVRQSRAASTDARAAA